MENAGWIEFDSPDLADSDSVEMSISEYDQPPAYPSIYPPKIGAPKKYGNTYRLELNTDLYEGVRYGWIHVRTFSAPWHITAVRLVCQTRPTNYTGSFSCSDTMLTRIWYTGAYTVRLNLLKDYLGAILMNRGDRFSWTGDAYPAQAASMVAFGNYNFVKKNIDFTANQSNGIRSYALYWVLSLVDYYRYTGDSATLRNYVSNACAKLDDAYTVYGTNPNLEYYGWDERLGAGFEHPNLPEPQNAYKMLSIRAWEEFSGAMSMCGRTDLRDKYNNYASEKILALKKDTTWYQGFGLHAAADAVTTRLLSTDEIRGIYEMSFTDRVNRLSYSPFNQYFIIQALALMNKYDDALSSIRDLWGGQVKYGGTTFFEDYRPSWNAVVRKNGPVPNNQCGFTSLCHPWGAGVTKWLSEEVLGIKPTSPGFATFDILPHLGRTLTNVSGKTSGPLGDINAGFNVSTGVCSMSSPAGTIGRVGIPKVEKNISRIEVNGMLAWDGIYHAVAGLGGASEDAQFVYFTDVLPGTYKFVTVYTGTTSRYSEPAWIYLARCTGIDSTTGGDWGRKYGKDGYLLCNYNGSGSDKKNLPLYVSSITYYKVKGNGQPLNAVWESNTDDRRALAPDTANSFPRNATCLYAMDVDQIGYTFTSTISIKGKHDYKISLYFLDWDHQGRKIAVEMFDSATSNLIAPVEIVKSCRGGAYLTYCYNKSAKFRINRVRGDNPVLSGIFFDPAVTRHTGVYIDRRPTASLRLQCKDEGVVLKHGDGMDSCDIYGAREAIVNKVGDSFYLFYDGAGKDGWEACLAKSTDLRNWIKIGSVLPLGDSSRNDSKAASSPWIIKSKDGWHMFYLGTPHATPAPDRIPAFPYLTMKAKANAIEGPWIKQYEVNPFTLKKDSYYSLTASPGFIIKHNGAFIQFFSGSMEDGNAVKRTLGIAITKDLNGSWKIMDKPLFPSDEQVENSSVYYDQKSKTWYLFTNHIGITKDNVEYTDAVWVYWSKDVYHWNENNKAVVLDSLNCSWAKGAIGMPSVVRIGDKLAMLYDGAPGNSISHMKRDIGLTWIPLPLKIF